MKRLKPINIISDHLVLWGLILNDGCSKWRAAWKTGRYNDVPIAKSKWIGSMLGKVLSGSPISVCVGFFPLETNAFSVSITFILKIRKGEEYFSRRSHYLNNSVMKSHLKLAKGMPLTKGQNLHLKMCMQKIAWCTHNCSHYHAMPSSE